MTQSEDGPMPRSEPDAARGASSAADEIAARPEDERLEPGAEEGATSADTAMPAGGAGGAQADASSGRTGAPPGQSGGTADSGASEALPRAAHADRPPVIDQVTDTTEDLARRAAPTVRDVGARVAIVTAELAEASGPWLERAAAATAGLSVRLAERARAFAAELERDAAEGAGPVASRAPESDTRTTGAAPGAAGGSSGDAGPGRDEGGPAPDQAARQVPWQASEPASEPPADETGHDG